MYLVHTISTKYTIPIAAGSVALRLPKPLWGGTRSSRPHLGASPEFGMPKGGQTNRPALAAPPRSIS